MREKPEELDRAFIAPFDQTDFFWTRELFVARRPLRPRPGTTAQKALRVSLDHSARRALRFRASSR